MSVLKVGLMGCGRIAQLVHLHVLTHIPDFLETLEMEIMVCYLALLHLFRTRYVSLEPKSR